MIYRHICVVCGDVEIKCSPRDAKETMPCPVCGKDSKRNYTPVLDIWKTDGAYSKTVNKE